MGFEFVANPIGRGRYEPEGIYLVAPFDGRRRIIQLWGEHPERYRRFRPGGAPLNGHNGLDFDLPPQSRIRATDAGYVLEIGNDPEGYGRYIKLAHAWGESLYAHLGSFSVESGQRIGRGARIGFSDSTGLSQGPHLHFAIRIHPYLRSDGWGGFSNPLPFLHPDDILLPIGRPPLMSRW